MIVSQAWVEIKTWGLIVVGEEWCHGMFVLGGLPNYHPRLDDWQMDATAPSCLYQFRRSIQAKANQDKLTRRNNKMIPCYDVGALIIQ